MLFCFMKASRVARNARASFALVKRDVSDIKYSLARLSAKLDRIKEDQKRLSNRLGPK